MPYWRLSAYYLFYFGALGALVPFWGPYLQSHGFSAAAIGALMAILMGTKLVAPMLWGWLADHFGARMPLVRISAFATCVTFVGIFWSDSLWSVALVMLVFSFFWNAALPQVESVTFNHLGAAANRYSQVRLWGSVGFVLVVGGLGWWVGRSGTGVIPGIVLALFVAVWMSAMLVPDCGHAHHAHPVASIRRLLMRHEIAFFLLSCFLMQFSHGIYYAFYSIHLEAAGYSSALIGALWALGVMAEVLLFLRMHWLLERFGARRILLASLALGVLRWNLIGWLAPVLLVQVLAQCLHAATFGAFHASAIHLVHHYFPGSVQGRGQALYNSLSFGAGGGAGSLLGGQLWGPLGAGPTFALASVAAIGGWLCVFWFVDRERHF
ncbi:MFS transporter [Thiorhodovibrio frisius]|uniref:Nitrate/nitrite transporter n=1 Tax=Thiorhodovibrio frisius TaxID=631362 RepID=H8YYK3_9GAMM|nr:MFS transporter [Thiorhodovibrio frisius]EIC23529.1 nitrate/nitrite transporter [Thiorhodovibrio frisius]WPL23384.1 putative 3-phenylpropionic acid transporter [Thiorhodovibrio frisius]